MSSLNKKNIEDVYGLTPMQEGMLFHYLMAPQSDHYFEQLCLGVRGRIRPQAFEDAWLEVIRRNEVLRSLFRWEKVDKPVQVVLKNHHPQIRNLDFSRLPQEDREHALERVRNNDRNEKFDLRSVPFRITLCKNSEEDFEIIISNHHILYDGWSGGIILKEFFTAYRRITAGKPGSPPAKRRFKEYVRWLDNRNGSDRRQYWAAYLKGVDSLVELSVKQNHVPDALKTSAGKYDVRFDRTFKEKLEKFARGRKVTLAALFYSAWGLLLQRYNNSEDVIFGITVSGRSAPLKGIRDIAGLFINTLPLRINQEADITLSQLVDRVHRDLQNQEPYENTALLDIKRFGGFENNRELFDTVVVVENYPLDITTLSRTSEVPLQVNRYSMNEMTHYDLTMVLSLFDDIEAVFAFDRNKFSLDTIKQLSHHFTLILTHIVYSPEDTVKEVNLLSEDEKENILYHFNDTSFTYPQNRTIHALFHDQAKRAPDRIAVGHDEEGAITYRELRRRVRLVTRRLKEAGLRRGDIAGLKLGRSIHLVAGILGTLSAGAVCLPLNPEYPGERIDYMMTDSNASILLTHDDLYHPDLEASNRPPGDVDFESEREIENDIKSIDPAYVIYTSGSTGKPKGVLLHHRGVINHAFTKQNLLRIDAEDMLCFSLSSGFVASLWLMFSPMFTGSTLLMYPNTVISDSQSLLSRVQRDHIAVLEVVPSLLQSYFRLLEEGEPPVTLSHLRAIVLTGEEILPQLVESLYRAYPHLQVFNAYGQSECSDDTLHYQCPPPREFTGADPVPLGKPSHNTSVYVLDKLFRLQPIGLAGELCITGDGLAYGYLNCPELTVSRFLYFKLHNTNYNQIPNSNSQISNPLPSNIRSHCRERSPFERGARSAGCVLYRTGDLAKWLPDGNIAFLGRLDQQVKVRGHRIELGGIEKQLLSHPKVKEAVVVVRNDNDKYLCAYWVAGENRFAENEDPSVLLRQYLSQRMPGYMIPSHIIQLDRFPLNANGKIHRRALPAPAFQRGKSYIPPRDSSELQMASVWAGVLGLPQDASLGIDDNFFENGGHSLKATHLSARIHKVFGKRLALDKIFAAPTIRQLTELVTSAGESGYQIIPAVEERSYYPLSSAQKRLYFLQQMDARNVGASYNMTSVLQLDGQPDRDRIQHTFVQLIQRHESFRTSFHIIDDQPVQVIHPQVEFTIGPIAPIGPIDKWVRPFDLSQAPLLRVALFSSNGTATMVVDMHHIISDGASAALLLKEFMTLYSGKSLPPLTVRYRDYTLWQTASRQRELLNRQRDFWLDQFRDPAPVIDLPLDYSRPPEQCFQGGKFNFTIGEEPLQTLHNIAGSGETTLFNLLLAAFSLSMNKLTGQRDIVVGTGVEGRPHDGLRDLVGMFVNTLALRTYPQKEKTFDAFLREIKRFTLNAFDNTLYPFEDLVEQLDVQRDTSRNPLFDVCLQLDNIDFPSFVLPGLTIRPQPFDPGISKFDLTLWVRESQGRLHCSLEYASALFAVETVACFARYFKEILLALTQPGATGLSLEILRAPSAARKNDILRRMNASLELDVLAFEQAHPQPLIQHYIERAMEKYPSLTAIEIIVEKGDRLELEDSQICSLTYSQLDRRSRAVAAGLKQRGLIPGTLTGVLMENRVHIIIAMIGIMRAGCVFVPLDKSLPAARLDTMIETTGLEHILTTIEIETTGLAENFSPVSYHPDDPLYIYFTSGSSGTPKAIIGKNKSTLHFIQWQIKTYRIGEKDRFSQLTTPGFDAFLRDTLVPLCSGGTVCVPPAIETLTEPGLLAQWLEQTAVNYVHCVPSVFRLFNNLNNLNNPSAADISFPALRAVFMSGERLNPADVEPWFERFGERIQVVNFYGPTETTMIKTAFTVNASSLHRPRIPVGHAMPGSQVMVMDERMEILEELMVGQLVIRTPFAAHGYFGQAPFPLDADGAVFYKTGDLGRILLDGTIDLLGRMDRQVKLRGMRVELGEIESLLLNHPRVREAAAVKNDTPSGAVLYAYVVPDENLDPDTSLTDYLSSLLPSYMIPAKIITLPEIPKKPNGKIDYQLLPGEPAQTAVQDDSAPEGSVAARVAGLWTEILNNGHITANQSFFEAGGNSLHLMTLIMKIQREFDLRLSLADIFNNLTVAQQADFIQRHALEIEEPATLIPVAPEQEYYPLSPAQNRLYILYRMEPASTGYNMTGAFRLKGRLDLEKLQHTFQRLIHRHQSLRTSFHMIDGKPFQKVHPEVEFSIGPIGPIGPIQKFIRPFDLSRPPLLRVEFKSSGDAALMLIDMHHIISDGYSMGVLIKDFMALYDDRELPALAINYKDYALWFNERRRRELDSQESYWLGRFGGGLPVLDLPLDFPRPAVHDFAGNRFTFEIDHSLTSALRDFSNRQDVSLYMTLLTAFVFLMYRLAGNKKDIAIGTPVAGRKPAELESLVGMFVNTLPLRFSFQPGETFVNCLHLVKQDLLAAMENQDYPFEDLVDTLAIDRDAARNPLFDVMFALQNMDSPQLSIPGLELEPVEVDNNISRFDLTLNIMERDQDLKCILEYATRLFREETIGRFARYYRNILSAIPSRSQIPMFQFEIMDSQEKRRILQEFSGASVTRDCPLDVTLHHMFRQQAARTPDRIAIIDDNGSYRTDRTYMSYGELNRRSDQLASHLKSQGVLPGSIIAIKLDRSAELVMGLLAILKTGAAYLPIDPSLPEERIDYMLKDSNSSMLRGTDLQGMESPLERGAPKGWGVSGSQPAYVIYTSGTTGRPKGVVVQHNGVVNLVHYYWEITGMTSMDRLSQVASPSFDAMGVETWPCILSGAAMCVAPDGALKEPERMKQWLIKEAVTLSFQPTPNAERMLLLNWPASARGLHTMSTGGDRLTRFPPPDLPFRLFDLYGPTEDTIVTTIAQVQPLTLNGDAPTPNIGKPVPNHHVFILGPEGEIQPTGVTGELCVSGIGTASGYLNRPELTASRFVNTKLQNTNVKQIGTGTDCVLYRTGDLVRWLPGGDIQFIGRIDRQVKIRGFRIELGEIENRLTAHENIKESAVTVREDQTGDKYLCAYVVFHVPGSIPVDQVKDYLSLSLPQYMVPPFVIEMPVLPLTTSGKLDRHALPAPNVADRLEFTPPGNQLEHTLASIWRQTLGLTPETPVSIDDSFFQIGGHSLKAVNLIAEVQRQFGERITLLDFFSHSTIREMAAMISEESGAHLLPVIETAETMEYYPLSRQQERMYILHRLDPQATVYNIPMVVRIEGHPDLDKTRAAFQQLIHRHPSLRTSFHLIDGHPVQKIHPGVEFFIGPIGPIAPIQNLVQPFDLTQPPLMRVLLAENGEDTLLGLDIHHIISDGLSMGILVKEFMTLYSGGNLPPLELQYRDYAVWQRRNQNRGQVSDMQAFWLDRFQSVSPALDLPLDFPRPPQMEFEGHRVHFKVDTALSASLNQWARQQDATLYMLLFTACLIWLQRLSGQYDITVGTPVAGRNYAGLDSITGMFVNTLALRHTFTGQMSPQALLQSVKTLTLQAFENQDFPFEELVELLGERIPRDMSRNPLFDVMLVVQNFDSPLSALTSIDVPGLKITPWEDYRFNVSKFDLTLMAEETHDEILFTLEYRTRLFKPDTIHRFASYFREILNAIIEKPGSHLAEIDILSPREKTRLLEEWNKTSTPYPSHKTLSQLFADRVAAVPDNAAIVAVENGSLHSLTYRELASRSTALAAYLSDRGARPGKLVALVLSRPMDTAIALLGVLKAGAAYLPIDPTYPEERIEFMIKDSAAALTLRGPLPETYTNGSGNNDAVDAAAESDLAYVIYTSGSTGRPKGVMIEHRSVVNTLYWRMEHYRLTPDHRALQLFSFAFDGFVTSFFTPLLSGAPLVMMHETGGGAPEIPRIKEIIPRLRISHLISVPSLYAVLLELLTANDMKYLQAITLAGEAVSPVLVERSKAKNPGLEIINEYGATENSVVATIQPDLTPRREIPVGKPIANTIILILDPNGRLQPTGFPGEICIGGAGIARGYLNNPELTRKRFIPSPFRLHPSLFYRTGDLAKRLEDGSIVFLGRVDEQVKIRGYRIEPGEIENRLLAHPGIRQAVVVVRSDGGGDNYLCAYIVALEKDVNLQLKNYLSKAIPAYMIPALFVELDEIPVTANGKIDRDALLVLPDPGITGEQSEYAAPRDETEARLLKLWQEVLAKQDLDIDGDFFQAGGHSLKATLLVSRIHRQFQRHVPLAQLFRTPTVREMAQYLQAASVKEFVPIPIAKPREYYPLSSAQAQLYVLHQMKSSAVHYNMPHAFKLDGPLDADKLNTAFRKLIQRHESLRTSFRTVAGQPFQVIHEHVDFTIRQIGPIGPIGPIKNLVRPFDLSRAPLLRVELMELEKDSHVLFVDMHHIVTDGTSVGILVNEFMALYEGRTLENNPVQYKDYALWRQQWMNSPERDRRQAFWLERLYHPLPRLSLPLDRPHGEEPSYEGGRVEFILDETRTAELNRLATGHGTTLYNVLLTIYYIMLFKLSGQQDIIVGAPVANRAHPDVQHIIGMFVNTLPLRNFPHNEKTFDAFLSEVSRRTLEAHENQEYPFETLVDVLMEGAKRDTSRNPVFDVLFLLQNMDIRDLKINRLTLNTYDIDFNASPFDLILLADEAAGRLRFKFLYSTALFNPETIERFTQYYMEIVSAVIADPSIHLRDIQLIRVEKPRARILEDADGDFGF